MTAPISAWKSHAWIARQLEFVPGAPLIQHICANCGRNFVEEIRTGNQYAVHVGVIRFNRLSEETTARWLADSCPGRRLESDKADLETRFFSQPRPRPAMSTDQGDAGKCDDHRAGLKLENDRERY